MDRETPPIIGKYVFVNMQIFIADPVKTVKILTVSEK
jgi:hypothetical protein